MRHVLHSLFWLICFSSFAQLDIPRTDDKTLAQWPKAKKMFLCIPDTINNYKAEEYKEALKTVWTNGDIIIMPVDKKDSLLDKTEDAVMLALEYKTPGDKKRPLREFKLVFYLMHPKGNVELGSIMSDIEFDRKGEGNMTPALLGLYMKTLTNIVRHQERVYMAVTYCNVKKISDTIFIPEFVTQYYPEKMRGPKIVHLSTANYFADSGLKYKVISNSELNRRLIAGQLNYLFIFTNFNRDGYAACYDVKKGVLLYQAKSDPDFNKGNVGKLVKCMEE